MFTRADVVFTGEVLSIERAEGAVTVRWQVQDAIRGVRAGEYVLREWAGLWSGDSARYTVGERALVLLHAPSLAGLASPVGGLDGVIPLRGDAAGSVLDLRWLAQQAAVTDAARLQPMIALRAAGGSLDVANALQARSATRVKNTARQLEPAGDAGSIQPDDDAPESPVATREPAAAVSYEQVDGAVVLGMLHAWQRASAGVH